jgi:hypothetical protein
VGKDIAMSTTARAIADQVVAARQKAWEKSDPTVAVVSTEELNPKDEEIVRRVVAEHGYEGKEFEDMARKVSALIVGKFEAMDDDMSADNAD